MGSFFGRWEPIFGTVIFDYPNVILRGYQYRSYLQFQLCSPIGLSLRMLWKSRCTSMITLPTPLKNTQRGLLVWELCHCRIQDLLFKSLEDASRNLAFPVSR